MTPTAVLITVTYNSGDKLAECWSDARDLPVPWVVVDNASRDDSADLAEKLGASVIRMPRNLGFGAANNVGAARSPADCYLFVNPDVQVDPATILPLCERALEHNSIVAPQLLNADGSLQENGRGDPYLAWKVSHLMGSRASRTHYERRATPGEVLPVSWATGAALVVPRRIFDRISGWDSSFFLYNEDVDLCLRAAAAGHGTLLDGSARWPHSWRRATRHNMSWTHWKHEIRSEARFYRRYPRFLVPPSVGRVTGGR